MSPSSFKKGRAESASRIPEGNVLPHCASSQARKSSLILAEGSNVLKTAKRETLTSKYQLTITLPIWLYHSNSMTLETKCYNYIRNSRELIKNTSLASASHQGLAFPELSLPSQQRRGKGTSGGSTDLSFAGALLSV